jgi:ketosteroid isomerase-like protein
MSQENLELARDAVEAFNRRDVEALTDLVTDDFEWFTWTGAVEPTTYLGPEGLVRYFRDADVWGLLSLEVDEYSDVGDRVLVAGTIRARGEGSGMEIEEPYHSAFDVRDGRLARVRSFRTRAEVMEAVESPSSR